jgi:hypothetical protein
MYDLIASTSVRAIRELCIKGLTHPISCLYKSRDDSMAPQGYAKVKIATELAHAPYKKWIARDKDPMRQFQQIRKATLPSLESGIAVPKRGLQHVGDGVPAGAGVQTIT